MLLVGRKSICRYLQCTWRTVRRRRKYALPIRRYPPDKPYLDTDEHAAWIVKYNQLLDEEMAAEK